MNQSEHLEIRDCLKAVLFCRALSDRIMVAYVRTIPAHLESQSEAKTSFSEHGVCILKAVYGNN